MLRLEMDGREFVFGSDSDADIVVSELELTWPDIRAVNEDRTGADGQIDYTQFFGARACTIKASVSPSNTTRTRQQILDEFRAFCHPSARPWLYFAEDGSERRIQLRADQQSAPISSPNKLDLAASWRCPNPFTEAAEASVVTMMPAADDGGLTFPITFAFTFGGSPMAGYIVGNAGTMPAGWVARIFGPCDGPSLTNGADTISLPDLTISDTEYVEIDSLAHTVRVNGDPGASRYGLLDTATLSWWQIQPGDNHISFVCDSSSGACQAELTYRDTWI